MQKYSTLKEITYEKLIGVIRSETAENAIQIAKAAITGGMKVIEITYTTPNVSQVFEALEDEAVLLGAGTVLDAETARHAILNGARFVVSPHFDLEIGKMCNRYSIPYLPGCVTINEIMKAVENGFDMIKLFPANNFEPNYIKSIKGPLPNVEIMPTGGINVDNIESWLDASAFAVGIGSDLNKAFKNGGSQEVTALVEKYISKIKK